MPFVNLHVHTAYSLLDSMIRIEPLVEKAKAMGQTALAITDHGTLAGAVKFTEACLKAGIKPIIGQEFYIAPDDMRRKQYAKGEHSYSHLILFARNEKGWRNLIRLSTLGYTEGFYRKPRIDRTTLQTFSEGLICTSACCGGDIAVHLMGTTTEAESAKVPADLTIASAKTAWYFSVFEDNFYLELQSYGRTYQEEINNWYRQYPAQHRIATADCHYLNKEDYDTHDTLLCCQTWARKDDPSRWRFKSDQFFLKSEQQMLQHFQREEVENTQRVADKIEFELPLRKQFFMPELPFEITRGDAVSRFRDLCQTGLAERNPKHQQVVGDTYYDRLEMEMNVFEKAGFVEYALLLWDLIDYCRTEGIYTGDGRGSGVGSLVLYSLGITKVDPISRDLPFERFINAGRLERFAPPDVDLDFPRSKRAQIIAYLKRRYGQDRVCQIGTYATLGPAALIRQLAPVLAIERTSIERLCRPIPAGEGSMQGSGAAGETSGLSLQDIYNQVADFKKEIDSLGGVGQALIAYGVALQKLGTHASKHASGILIADRPVADLVPLMKGDKESDEVTMSQFDMFDCELLGLIKFDILGLKTLDVLDYVEKSIQLSDPTFSLDDVDLDDPLAYRLLCENRTTGIFQASGGGFGRLLPVVRPTTVEHLSALTSLCRPGPTIAGLTDMYVRRVRGEEAERYAFLELKPVLERTHGVMAYQEDIMNVAHLLAGYSLAEADDLRKVMGKKQRDKMSYHKPRIIDGLQKHTSATKEMAEEVWRQMESMAEYVFNRGHAMAYSYLTAKCAWAKTYYPAYFLAGTMSQEAMGDSAELPALLSDARYLGVNVRPPNINEAGDGFIALDEKTIMVGLRGIKGVGEKAVEVILEERAKGLFKSVEEFRGRIPARSVNSAVMTALENAGAFDSLQGRQRLVTTERLLEEFELFGFFLSGHPIERLRPTWGPTIAKLSDVFADISVEKYPAWREGRNLMVVGSKRAIIRGIVTKLEKKKSKRTNQFMYFVDIEDESAIANSIINQRHLKTVGLEDLKKGSFLEFVGRKANQNDRPGSFEIESIRVLTL